VSPATGVLGPPPAGLPVDWPLREFSHTAEAGGLRWHVQRLGPYEASGAPHPGPLRTVLLLHGSGASAHSWAALAALLRQRCRVIVPDLPGHAFSQRPAASGLTLPAVAASLGALLGVLGESPDVVIGHSAGAAVGARWCLDGGGAPQALVAVNGAWFPPGGVDRWWYAPAARLLTRNPLVPHLFAWHASRPAALKRLIDSTGSALDAQARAPYAHLVGNAAHVSAVLALMAAWDLKPLLADLPHLRVPLHLLVGSRDGTVPPAQAEALHRRLPGSRLHRLDGLGHLAHEEDAPAVLANLLKQGLV
jgi:magnesium chelatase accessory protein